MDNLGYGTPTGKIHRFHPYSRDYAVVTVQPSTHPRASERYNTDG
jgi:hypothetical protein